MLELRLAALVPDAQLITRSDGLAAWASRRHSATIVYWLDDGTVELTVDEDLEQAIATIVNDIAAPRSSVRPAAGDLHQPSGDRLECKRYGQAVSEPVITRVVAIEELPPGSRATRRLIAEWSDGSQSEALAWFSDEWLVSEGDLMASPAIRSARWPTAATASGSGTSRPPAAATTRSLAHSIRARRAGPSDHRHAKVPAARLGRGRQALRP